MAAATAILRITRRLAREASALRWRTPSHVYNPLNYAWSAHAEYLARYGVRRGRVLLLGMNPGPWGMAQTGVPFGDPMMVREWLKIETRLARVLPVQHSKYPILGMHCRRHEGSGSRLWGWARQRFGRPERFFARFFVWNYCPLLFLHQNHNLTPQHLNRREARALEAVCDRALLRVVQLLKPAAVVGIGRYAEARACKLFEGNVPLGYLAHPSPASPAANRNWMALAERALKPWLPRR